MDDGGEKSLASLFYFCNIQIQTVANIVSTKGAPMKKFISISDSDSTLFILNQFSMYSMTFII